MEELLKELISVIDEQNHVFPWGTLFSGVALLVSIVTVSILLRERVEKIRPYLSISFELVRSSLACIVLRNTGNVPLELKSLRLSKEFTKQLPMNIQERLEKKTETNIAIFPNKMWVLSLDINVPDVIGFENTTVNIEYEYTKIGHNKKYVEGETIDFREYSGMLLYISEIDEFNNCIKDLTKAIKAINEDSITKMVINSGSNEKRETL